MFHGLAANPSTVPPPDASSSLAGKADGVSTEAEATGAAALAPSEASKGSGDADGSEGAAPIT
jgi:hypothetical protein